MRRPGPLQELPLELFTHTEPAVASKMSHSHKRPLSPGAPNLFSPTKRRLLAEEGIFFPINTSKSPASRGTKRIAPPAAFADALTGPGSPARKLNFGLPKNHHDSCNAQPERETLFEEALKTPTRSTSHRLAPSPELTPKSRSGSHSQCDIQAPEMNISANLFAQPSPSRLSRVPILVRREMPSAPDPQSEHYPGFDVHLDTHISLPHASDTSQEADLVRHADREWYKENVPPRRRAKKVTTTPLPAKSSPRGMNVDMDMRIRANTTDASMALSSGGLGSPTPTRKSLNILPAAAASPLTPQKKKDLKMMMLVEDEVDDDAFLT